LIERYAAAPVPAHRLIPSRFPPIGLFDTVTTAADLEPVMELAGWTNDRLVTERINRLPRDEWVYGRPNASIVMAAFLHVTPGGMRFNNGDLGAWYAAAALTTSVAEVAHHMRREAVARGITGAQRKFRQYTAALAGSYLDLRGQQVARPDVYDPTSYAVSQALGETVRASGSAGIVYDSVRHTGGLCVVAHRPRNISEIAQGDHFEISVQAAASRIDVRKLSA
jgi:RES domain-containing protein